jgi:hypothetical protein
VFKTPTASFTGDLPSENGVDGVKEAGFSRAYLTNQKDVRCRHVYLCYRAIFDQFLLEPLSALQRRMEFYEQQGLI